MWKPDPERKNKLNPALKLLYVLDLESSWEHWARKIGTLPEYMSAHHLSAWLLETRRGHEARREHGSPGTGIIDGCNLPSGCWESNPSPLENNQFSELLSNLQAPIYFIIMCMHLCLLVGMCR